MTQGVPKSTQRVPWRATSDPIGIPDYSRVIGRAISDTNSTPEYSQFLGRATSDPRFTPEYSRVLWIAIRDLRYNPEYSRLIGRATNDPMSTPKYFRGLRGGESEGRLGVRGGGGWMKKVSTFPKNGVVSPTRSTCSLDENVFKNL